VEGLNFDSSLSRRLGWRDFVATLVWLNLYLSISLHFLHLTPQFLEPWILVAELISEWYLIQCKHKRGAGKGQEGLDENNPYAS
jgi:hypothetical protein